MGLYNTMFSSNYKEQEEEVPVWSLQEQTTRKKQEPVRAEMKGMPLKSVNIESLNSETTRLSPVFCKSKDWKQLGNFISRLLQLQSLEFIRCKAGDEFVASITNCPMLAELTICNELLIQRVVESLARELR